MSDAGRPPKHRQVYHYLRQQLAAGAFPPGERLPTERELVERFGVSRPTVIHALRDLEQEGLLERRRGAGTFPRPAERPAEAVFGVIISGVFSRDVFRHTIFAELLGELTRAGRAEGCALLFGGELGEREPGEMVEHAEALVEQYLRQRVGGIFFVPLLLPPAHMPANLRLAERISRAGVPLVLLDRDLEAWPKRSGFDLIALDNFSAGYELTRHLLARGARRIDFVATDRQAWSIQARVAGWRTALSEADGAGEVHAGVDFDPALPARLAQAPRPEAIIAYNDDVAAFLLRELLNRGVRIPEDLRLAGFDDSALAALPPVPLTTVRQPAERLGEAALRLMQERRRQPDLPARTLFFAPRLAARASTG